MEKNILFLVVKLVIFGGGFLFICVTSLEIKNFILCFYFNSYSVFVSTFIFSITLILFNIIILFYRI